MTTHKREQGIYLFKNEDGIQYVYFTNINSVFEVSQEVVDFLNGTENKEVEAEIESILNTDNPINTSIRRIIYSTAGKREESTLEAIFEKDRSYVGNVFLELSDNDNSKAEHITNLSSVLHSKGLNVKIKKSLYEPCEGCYAETYKENNTILRCSLDHLKKLIGKNNTLPQTVEVDLRTMNELDELFEELHLPDGLRILVNGHADNMVAGKIVEKFSDIVSDFFVNYEKGKFINGAYLLKMTIGSPITDLDIIRVDKNGMVKGEECKICNGCWAKTLCWNTYAFYIFSNHPSLTSKEKKNCEHIRKLITNLLVLRLNNEDNRNDKQHSPQIFSYNGLQIKLLNP